jgi:hypothetical protein
MRDSASTLLLDLPEIPGLWITDYAPQKRSPRPCAIIDQIVLQATSYSKFWRVKSWIKALLGDADRIWYTDAEIMRVMQRLKDE